MTQWLELSSSFVEQTQICYGSILTKILKEEGNVYPKLPEFVSFLVLLHNFSNFTVCLKTFYMNLYKIVSLSINVILCFYMGVILFNLKY